jgi:uncharacterized protein
LNILAIRKKIKMTNIHHLKISRYSGHKHSKTVQLYKKIARFRSFRYRKDTTGNLDEVQIEHIAKLQKEYEAIAKRKEAIVKSIEEQNGLTPELEKKYNKVLIYRN